MAFEALIASVERDDFQVGDRWRAVQHAEQTRLNFNAHEDRLLAVEALLPTNLAQIYRATVTLTDAQIKALPTTPISLVAAPGAGFYTALLGVELQGSFALGAYTNVDADAALGVALDGSEAAGAAPSERLFNAAGSPAVESLTDFLAAVIMRARLGPSTAGSSAYAGDLVADLENKALRISVDNNGAGDFTGGHVANTLRIVVLYTLEVVP